MQITDKNKESNDYILTEKDVQFILYEEIKKLEPYLVEESNEISLVFLPKTL
jgi:hypothetical protein